MKYLKKSHAAYDQHRDRKHGPFDGFNRVIFKADLKGHQAE